MVGNVVKSILRVLNFKIYSTAKMLSALLAIFLFGCAFARLALQSFAVHSVLGNIKGKTQWQRQRQRANGCVHVS